MFWGNVIRVLMERGWTPPKPDERAIDDLMLGMEAVRVPNDIADLREAFRMNAGPLSPREYQVMQLVMLGHSNQEIASELGMASQTVKFHLTNVFQKLGVKNRTEAVFAMQAADATAA